MMSAPADSSRQPRSRPLAGLAGVMAALIYAHVLFSRAVVHGIGLATDFGPYTLPARRLLAGGNFSITHHPPLYPLTIFAVAVLARLDPFAAAECVQWACYLVLPLLAGALVWRLTSPRLAPAAFAMLALACSPDALDLGAQIASEHLFAVFTLGALAALIFHLEKAGGACWLATYTALAALALLTRYAGAALVGTGALLLLAQDKGWPRRLMESGAASAVALAPCAGFVLWNYSQQHTIANRELSFKGVPWHKFDHAFQAMLTWWVPQPLVTFSGAVAGVSLIALGWAVLVRSRVLDKTDRSRRGLIVLGVFCLGYFGFILAAAMFADAWIPFDHRILFPVMIAATVATALALGPLLSRPARWQRSLGLALLLAFSILNLRRGWNLSRDWAAHGIGFSGPAWQDIPLAEQVRRVPPDATVLSNRPAVVYTYTQASVLELPSPFDYLNARPNRNLQGEYVVLSRALQAAPVAYFVEFKDIAVEADARDLLNRLDFQRYFESPEGILWRRGPARAGRISR